MSKTLSVVGAVALLAISSAPAFAETLRVTRTDDDGDRAGTLRAVLERAQPGDVVRFDVGGPIVLKSELRVQSDGVEIVGPATIRSRTIEDDRNAAHVLAVEADDVALRRLSFEPVVVHVRGGARGVRITDCRFGRRGGKLIVEGAHGTIVGAVGSGNVFDRLWDSSVSEGSVRLIDDVGTRVSGNRFLGAQTSLQIAFSEDVVVDHNDFVDSGVDGHPESGAIRENRIRLPRNGREGNGILVRESPQRAQPGLVEIVSNRLRVRQGTGAISVSRPNVIVRGNRVRAPSGRRSSSDGIVVASGHPYHPGPATVTIADNRVIGSEQGILSVSEREREPTVSITGNTVSRARGLGLAVGVPAVGSTVVTGNRVLRGLRSSDTSHVSLFSRGGNIAFDGNVIRASDMPALQVLLRGGEASITNTRIARGAGPAVRVLAGEGTLTLSSNTILRVTGDAYRFEPGSRGVVSLVGSTFDGIEGDVLSIDDAADVELLD